MIEWMKDNLLWELGGIATALVGVFTWGIRLEKKVDQLATVATLQDERIDGIIKEVEEQQSSRREVHRRLDETNSALHELIGEFRGTFRTIKSIDN